MAKDNDQSSNSSNFSTSSQSSKSLSNAQSNRNNVQNRQNNNREHQTMPAEEGNPNCPVCLNRVQERSFTNSCLREFCLPCIQEWSRNHNRCPVCR
jgi:E3 ubiquitin-protein ligase Topors